MRIHNTLSTYMDGENAHVDYILEVSSDGVLFILEYDHLEFLDGSIAQAIHPRAVKIELRPDGDLNVLVYSTDAEEPHHLILTCQGDCKRAEP